MKTIKVKLKSDGPLLMHALPKRSEEKEFVSKKFEILGCGRARWGRAW
jgi:hypothetical protein